MAVTKRQILDALGIDPEDVTHPDDWEAQSEDRQSKEMGMYGDALWSLLQGPVTAHLGLDDEIPKSA